MFAVQERNGLQVHHVCYRGDFRETILKDLETLCRKCHRLEHGFGPTDFQSKCREVTKYFGYIKRPPVSDWKELKSLIENEYDLQDFADVMFRYIINVVAHEQEQFKTNWWMDKEKSDRWFLRAHNVRESILERI